MRQDDRGFSLVELIIAMAIASIIMGAAIMFMNSAQRSYRTAESTINLQVESQILMEQLANWVMESNRMAMIRTSPSYFRNGPLCWAQRCSAKITASINCWPGIMRPRRQRKTPGTANS